MNDWHITWLWRIFNKWSLFLLFGHKKSIVVEEREIQNDVWSLKDSRRAALLGQGLEHFSTGQKHSLW